MTQNVHIIGVSKKYNIILTCLFLIIQCACIEPLEISNNLNEFALVVDGKITQKDVVHKLYLSRTSNLGAFRYVHVRGAQIDLCDTEGNRESYFEDPANEYYVLLGDQLSREPGNSYYIEIKINNSLYRSTPQMMPDIIEADTLRVSVEREQTINSYGNVIENNYISLSFLNSSTVNCKSCSFWSKAFNCKTAIDKLAGPVKSAFSISISTSTRSPL